MLTCSEQLGREQASNHWPGGSEHPDQHTLFRGYRWQPLHPGLRLLGQELPCLLHRNWCVCISINTGGLTFNFILSCHVSDAHLLNRKAHPDSVWPLGCGDLSGQVRVLYRRRLLHRVWLQRCDSSSVVLEWKAPHHRGQPQQQWVVEMWGKWCGCAFLCVWFVVTLLCLPGDYPAPRAVLTGHDHEVVCVSVCAELGLVISGAKGEMEKMLFVNTSQCQQWHTVVLCRGPVPGSHHHRRFASCPGGAGVVSAAPAHLSVQRGPLHHLLWERTLLQL